MKSESSPWLRQPKNSAVIRSIALFVIALAFRLWILIPTIGFDYTPTRDDHLFDDVAWTLTRTGRYALDEDSSPTASISPLFPSMLAGIYWAVGHRIAVAQVLTLLLGAAAAPLVMLLGRDIGDMRVGVLAGLGTALDPLAAPFAGVLWTETLFSLLFITSILLLLHVLKSPSSGRVIALGISLGLLTLARPNGLMTAAMCCVLLFLEGKGRWVDRLKQAVQVLAVVIILLIPWIVRNYLTFDRFIPTTSDTGRVLVGFYNETCLEYRCLEWIIPERLPELEQYGWKELDEIERNELGTELAISFLRKHPTEFLNLLPGKLGFFWAQDTYFPPAQPPYEPPQILFEFQKVYYWILFAGGILGLIVLYIAGRRQVFVVLTSFVALFSLTTLLLWGSARFRLPLHPLLAISASYMLVAACDRLFRRRETHQEPELTEG